DLERSRQHAERALSESRREAELLKLRSESILAEQKQQIARLKSVRFGKDKRIAELKGKLATTRRELENQTKGPVGLSTVPGRQQAQEAAPQLLPRLAPIKLQRKRSGVDHEPSRAEDGASRAK